MDKNLKSLFSSKMTRRQFLSRSLAAFAAMNLSGSLLGEQEAQGSAFKTKNIVLVTFGGGVRNTETISDPQHKYIPNLWNTLRPQGTLYPNVYNQGKILHGPASASLLTGNWEWRRWGEELNWHEDLPNPTIFEYFRKSQNISAEQTWHFSGWGDLMPTESSRHKEYGPAYGGLQFSRPALDNDLWEQIDLYALRICQERNLKNRLSIFKEVENLLRSKVPFRHSVAGGSREVMKFSQDFYSNWRKDLNNWYAHDDYICGAAMEAMKLFQPRLITISLSEIDVAHSGNWSRHIEAIRKTDTLTLKLWEAIQHDEYYKDKTTMLIIPDHGREAETPNGVGYVRHGGIYDDSGVDEACRHVWLLAIGPDIHKNKIIEKRKEHIDIAPTIGELLGFDTPYAKGKAITEMFSA